MMISIEYFIFCVTVTGLVVGSFLNVCIYRIPKGISLNGNHGRSMCASCKKTLKWYDLVPVFSYLMLRGRCRDCQEKISKRYPVIELINAILWGLCAYYYQIEWKTAIACIFCSVLLVLSMIDWDTQEIPYRFQAIILGLGIVSLFLSESPTIGERLIGIVIVSVPMIIITLIFDGFGGGDIQLMATSGFLLGYKVNVMAMVIGTILAAVIGSFLLKKKKDEAKVKMPFGPFLSLGLVSAMFWGTYIYDWYFSFF